MDHRTFYAHSHILRARSPYLKGALSVPMREAESKQIKETEMAPEAFEILLQFIYTDEVEGDALNFVGEDLIKV